MKAETVVFEEREGGRVYEVMSDGTEGTWATILAWDPPRRLRPGVETEPHGQPADRAGDHVHADGGGTRVDLEHRGWERLGALAEEARAGYGENWNGVLALFVGLAEQDREEG